MRCSALMLLALAACDPIDTVVARIPDGGMVPTGDTCTVNSECQMDEFCDKATCGAATGHCHHRMVCMDDDFHPTCGCNGVTYWNDCLRQADGTSLAEMNECSVPIACNGPGDCSHGPGAACAHLVVSDDSCPAQVSGVCWFIPPTCPAGAITNWEPCSGGACMDLCGAIRSQQPAIQKASCP